jgi:hypothetical protein
MDVAEGDMDKLVPLIKPVLQDGAMKVRVPEGQGGPAIRRMLVPLFRDLSQVLSRRFRPIASPLERYLSINTDLLAGLAAEPASYLGPVLLCQDGEKLVHGLSHADGYAHPDRFSSSFF